MYYLMYLNHSTQQSPVYQHTVVQYIAYLHAADLTHSAHGWVMVWCKTRWVVTLNGDYEMLPLSKCAPVTDQGLVKTFNECDAGHHEEGPVGIQLIAMWHIEKQRSCFV